MDKFTTVFMLLWAVLAVAAFVVGFWAPLLVKVVSIVFGVFNLSLIGGWIITYFQNRKNKLLEE